jgi:hypothetical protein
MRPSVLTAAELEQKLSAEFPETFGRDGRLAILDVWHGGCRVRLGFAASTLRPGQTWRRSAGSRSR